MQGILFLKIFFCFFIGNVFSLSDFRFQIRRKFFVICSVLIFSPLQAFSHGPFYSDKEIETALAVLEKALLFSPEFLDKTEDYKFLPFYEVDGHKIYLDEGFWRLTRAWLKIYIEEIEKYCLCDLDPDLMLEEAKNYLPQSPLANTGKKYGGQLLSTVINWSGRYGYTFAQMKLSVEAVESVFLGPFHIACNVFDVLIVVFVRTIQRYFRSFYYGSKFNAGSLRTAAKRAWIFRKVKKRQKELSFYIEQALVFREQELAKVNREVSGDRRLLWIESLKKKTDPLFQQIAEWEEERDKTSLSKERRVLTKKIKKAKGKIENLSKITRKDFFGTGFKRFLLRKFGKGLSGHHLQDKVLGTGVLKRTMSWPLSLQENIMEQALESPSSMSEKKSVEIKPDEIRNGLIEEFLLKIDESEVALKGEDGRKDFLQNLLWDIDQIFNTEIPSAYRMMKASSVEEFLGTTLFALYFELSSEFVIRKYNLSFKEQKKLSWEFALFFKLIDAFSDFLSVVSTIKDKTKIQFYKYESMEKLLAFFDYAHEVQVVLKADSSHIDKEAVFKRLKSKRRQLQSLSLLRKKKTVSGIRRPVSKVLPRVKPFPQCKKLVEKYQ